MSDTEASHHSEEEEEEEEEDFTNLPLYDDKDDDSDISEYALPSESENEAARAKKAKSRRDSQRQSEPLSIRPAPKKSSAKKSSLTDSGRRRSRSKSRSRSRAVSEEAPEDPAITARRLENLKRKAPRPPSHYAAIMKRQKLETDNQYLLLLNSQVAEAATPKLGRREWKLKRTQVGASIWHSREKGRLYVAIERVGRYDYKAIAELIGNKSEYEVIEYIRVFEEDIEMRDLRGRGEHYVEETEIPAAVEISEECELLLDESAHALMRWQDGKDRRKQIRKWGADAWLLSAENVSWIEKDASDKAGETVIKEVLPAAELLNLKNWLKLSKGVFMNPTERPEENWQEVIEPGQKHGIFATAFMDFQTLTMNLTKRIMAATLFVAESRLRADDSSYAKKHGRLPLVTHLDVATAVEDMGLKLDSHEFWRTAPRRNHLQMVDDEVDDRKGGVAPMSHDLVEKVLSKRKKIRSKRRMRTLASADRSNMSSAGSAYDSESEGSHISVSSDDDDEAHETQEIKRGALRRAPVTEDDTYIELYSRKSRSLSPTPAPSIPAKPFEEQTPEERHLAYVESVDHTENVKAEIALWQLLQQDHPFAPEDMNVAVAEAAELPRVVLKQKDPLDTDKWRERVEYWAPWEHMDSLPTEEDFKRGPKKERREVSKGPVRPKPKAKHRSVRMAGERLGSREGRRSQSVVDISDKDGETSDESESEDEDEDEDEDEEVEVEVEVEEAPVRRKHGERKRRESIEAHKRSGRPRKMPLTSAAVIAAEVSPVAGNGDDSDEDTVMGDNPPSTAAPEVVASISPSPVDEIEDTVIPDTPTPTAPASQHPTTSTQSTASSASPAFQRAEKGANDSRLESDQNSVLGTRRAEMARSLQSSPVMSKQARLATRTSLGASTRAKTRSQEEGRGISPVFSNTQLDALMGTQEPMGSLEEMDVGLDWSESGEEEDDSA